MRTGNIDELRACLQAEMVGEPAWIVDRQLERRKADLEAAELELEERLAAIRKREAADRARERAHVRKKPVRELVTLLC